MSKLNRAASYASAILATVRIIEGNAPAIVGADLDGAVLRLSALAKRIGGLNEADCNYGLSARQDRARLKACADVRAIVATFGPAFTAEVSGDPRGCSVKVIVPNGRYNTWGGAESGWAIPTA